ncbi:NHLP family bacteriocin export ABC transporter peptidase/permease/ATPase subunit [Nostocales cyanobacterium HT-58-2]|nr:NHLP family bacteriocin export ABC transporter peptidase/permease/ATPase subunit [Nostocales cyanobacterium HT-58-2]
MVKLQNPFQKRRARVKTPTLLQMEAVECGAAALGIILSYYGCYVPLTELRQECGVSRDGITAINLVRAARNYGLEAKGFKKELDALLELPCPYIIFWNFNHFLVVEGFQANRVYLNDPATGPRSVSLVEFDEAYTGVVLVMQPGPNFRKQGRKFNILLSLGDRLKSAWVALAYCVLAGFLLVIPGLATSAFTQVFVDNVLVQGLQDWLRPLLLGMLLTAVIKGILTWLRFLHLRRLKIKLAMGMSSKFLWHILRLPISFYGQRYAGEIASRVSINDRVANVLSGQLATTTIDCVMLIFYAAIMIWYDWLLTAIGICFALVNLLVLQWMSRRRVDAHTQLTQELGKIAGLSIAGLKSIEVIKASGLESDFFARWAGYQAKATNAQQELGLQNQTLTVLPPLLSALMSMVLLVVGGLRVMDGHLSIGMLVAFQSLMISFLAPVNNLVNLGSTLQELESDISRLDDVLHNSTDPQTQPEEIIDESSVSRENKFRLQGYVELRNVTFGYSRATPPLIQNFSLSIKPGQRVALVGGSGSGKSTIAKLVSGLYEPWEGEICFDGYLRSQIPRQVLSNSIALVEQDIFLFGGSVRDNLSLWDTTLSDRHLRRACKDAVIHDVILSKPGGYDGELLEGGVNLSGGQRQRLEIARALVNNPSILVLDEATSALDAETEKMIDQNLRLRGCSCIIIAHRLSTIRDCDEIIVLDRGQVVQRGTHETLRLLAGKYAQLLNSEGAILQEVR